MNFIIATFTTLGSVVCLDISHISNAGAQKFLLDLKYSAIKQAHFLSSNLNLGNTILVKIRPSNSCENAAIRKGHPVSFI